MMPRMSSTHHPSIVPGRTCDACAMCCKLPEIKALDKPRNQWCSHCADHQRCSIYEARPQTCRNFHCLYLLEPSIPQAWQPAQSRMILTNTEDGNHLFVQVDPARPDAWRKPAYHAQLREWARINNAQGKQIVVCVGNRYIVIFPDHEEAIGNVSEDDTVQFSYVQTPSGPVARAQQIKMPSRSV